MKVRLKPNNVLVARIPENKFGELQISAVPEWLRFYKNDTNSVQRLYRWGYLYNGWGECARALTYLERAGKIDPKFKGLAVELAFSYNCLQQYERSEQILEAEIKVNPADAYVNKEYVYTLVKSGKIDKAESQFEKTIVGLADKRFHAENSFNIMQYFFAKKNREKFLKWYDILLKQPNENKMIAQYADAMKSEMNK